MVDTHEAFKAAVWRLVRLTDEACALVVSRAGRVLWYARGDACPPLGCERGDPLAEVAAAAAVTRGDRPWVRPWPVPRRAWLANPRDCRGSLLESTLPIRQTGQVLSVLWMPELREGPIPPLMY